MPCSTAPKRVLFVTYEFPPMGGVSSIWAAKYIKYLPDFGWEPVVITVKDAPTNLHDYGLAGEIAPDLRIVRTFSLEPTRLLRLARRLSRRAGGKKGDDEQVDPVYSYSGLPFRMLTRLRALFVPDEKIGWFPFALFSTIRTARATGAQLIFSSAPPFTTHVVAAACKALTGLPWACEFRDPLVDYTLAEPPTMLNKMTDRCVERMIVHRADAVVCAMQGIADGFSNRYLDLETDRYRTITGGFDPDDFEGECPLEEKFTMTWIGSMYSSLYPSTFFSVFKEMLEKGEIDREDCTLRIVGTMDVEALRAIREMGMDGLVELTGFLGHQESIKRMRSSHLLLMQLGPGKVSEMVYAGKMFEYFAAARPVLALVYEGATSRLLRELGAGAVVAPDDREGIRGAISFYYDQYKHGAAPVGGDPEKINAFDKKAQTAKLAAIFDTLAGHRDGAGA